MPTAQPWDNTLLKLGNEGQQADQRIRQGQALERLRYLAGQKQMRDDGARNQEAFDRSGTGPMPLRTIINPHAPKTNSDYLRTVNEDAELADLENRFSGGEGIRVGAGGTNNSTIGGPSPARSLARASGGGVEDDATNYQLGRAALDRTLNDNFAAKWAQRGALGDADRARDPNLREHDAARGQEAADTRAIDSFRRMEPTRALHRRETRQGAEEMLPYDARVIQAQVRNSGVIDTNDARRDVAQTNAGARTGAAAINSLARTATAQTFGDPAADQRVAGATSAILPNVPGQANGLKPLPPEWDFNVLIEKFGGDPKAAEAWLNQNGYRR